MVIIFQFFCIFDQINAILLSIKDIFQKLWKIILSSNLNNSKLIKIQLMQTDCICFWEEQEEGFW